MELKKWSEKVIIKYTEEEKLKARSRREDGILSLCSLAGEKRQKAIVCSEFPSTKHALHYEFGEDGDAISLRAGDVERRYVDIVGYSRGAIGGSVCNPTSGYIFSSSKAGYTTV